MRFVKITKKNPLQIKERIVSCKKTAIQISSIQNTEIVQEPKALPQAFKTWKTLGIIAVILGGVAFIGTLLIYGWLWFSFGGWIGGDYHNQMYGGLFGEMIRLREMITTPSILVAIFGVIDLIVVGASKSVHRKITNSLGLKVTMQSSVYFFSSNKYDDLESLQDLIILRKHEMSMNMSSKTTYIINGDGNILDGRGATIDQSSIKVNNSSDLNIGDIRVGKKVDGDDNSINVKGVGNIGGNVGHSGKVGRFNITESPDVFVEEFISEINKAKSEISFVTELDSSRILALLDDTARAVRTKNERDIENCKSKFEGFKEYSGVAATKVLPIIANLPKLAEFFSVKSAMMA